MKTKNSLQKILNDDDLKEGCLNFTSAYVIGHIANIASNHFLNFDLNAYNSVEHFAIGVGVGSLAYKKYNGGIKGLMAGLIAGSLFNASWESYEFFMRNHSTPETLFDTGLDIGIVYVGNFSSAIIEKIKANLNKEILTNTGEE